MQENIEHDRMICSNYDRQSITFFAPRDDKFYYTFNNEEGPNEIKFLSCKRHENSELIEKDWSIIRDEKSYGLLIRGLRSPCLNATYIMNDSRDNLGMNLSTYDGVSENEREKETFYIESMLPRLAKNHDGVETDELHECRTVRTIAKIRNVLNDFGRMKRLPRSMVCVDEDFHYMRGKNGSNDDCLKKRKQSWPLRSIFDARDPTTPKLNCTLSLTCSDQDVEILKKCLFKDPFESRKEFIHLRENGRNGFSHLNEDEYFCCECEYIKCTHFDDEKSLGTSSRCYLALTCPICVFKIGKS